MAVKPSDRDEGLVDLWCKWFSTSQEYNKDDLGMCLHRWACSSARSILLQNAFWNLKCLHNRDRWSFKLTPRARTTAGVASLGELLGSYLNWFNFSATQLNFSATQLNVSTTFPSLVACFVNYDSEMETKCHKHKFTNNFLCMWVTTTKVDLGLLQSCVSWFSSAFCVSTWRSHLIVTSFNLYCQTLVFC
jgi:hypothetical protein